MGKGCGTAAKGARKERMYVNKARAEGKIAFRSSASRSAIDVCIIDEKTQTIELLQCKPENFPISAKLKLEAQHAGLNDIYNVSFKVV